MKSDVIRSVFLDELERNKRLISRYEKEMEDLPKGAIFKRKIGTSEYIYLNYREGKKVISKFIGKTESINLIDLTEKLAHRKELQALIRKLKTEQKELEKELK